MQTFARPTLLRRRLFLLSFASVIPLAVLAAFGIGSLRAQYAQEVQHIGQEMSRSIANAVDAELQSVVVALRTLSTATTLERGDLQGFAGRLGVLIRQQPGWYDIVLTTTDGTILAHAQDADVPNPMPLDTAGDVRLDAGPAIGGLVLDSRNRWYFPVRVPVVRDAQTRYVLSALVSPTVIRDAIARQRVPPDWVISIVDQQNRRVARSRAHDENLGGALSPSALAVMAGGGAEGFGVSTTLEGERIYTPYSRLGNGWAAVLGLPTKQTDAAMQRTIAIYAGGVLLSIALGLLGAGWVGRTITRPIAELRDAAAAVGHRQSFSKPATRIQEVRELGAALHAAAEELRRSETDRDAALARERAAREAAEAADRSKDEFLSVLSHELRTPLNAVYGWGRMLQTGQLRDEAAARARDAIVRNAAIQVQMVDDLLDLSRIASGKMRIDLQPVDLVRVISAAIEAVRPAAVAKQIAIAAEIGARMPPIAGDAGRLQQIFWNLFMNAVKFTPAGGRVDIAVRVTATSLQVVVRDTGEGIDADVLPHVFERFRQGDSSFTRPHGGLGLGLALVKHLTEIHGGRVEAESQGRGSGATFTVTLPLGASDVHEPPGAPPVPAVDAAFLDLVSLDSIRVVLIDDDPEGLRLTETVLAQAGARVACGTSANEGLALLRSLRPDVLISDLGMPGEDGYSLITRVRSLKLDEGGRTPAVALTAYGRSQDRVQAIALGYDVHITKPVDPVTLTSLVKSLCRRPADDDVSPRAEHSG